MNDIFSLARFCLVACLLCLTLTAAAATLSADETDHEGSTNGRQNACLRSSTDAGTTSSQPLKILKLEQLRQVAWLGTPNGHIVAPCRMNLLLCQNDETLDHHNGLRISISSDDGRTWSPVTTQHRLGRHHPSLTLLPSREIVMRCLVRTGDIDSAERFPQLGIKAVISRDHGQAWDLEHRSLLHHGDGHRQGPAQWWSRCQATSTVQLPDGDLLTAFGMVYGSSPNAHALLSPREVGLVPGRTDDVIVASERQIPDTVPDPDLRNVFDPNTAAKMIEVHPVYREQDGMIGVEYRSGHAIVGRSSDQAPAGVELLLPGAESIPVQFPSKTDRDGVVVLGPATVGDLTLRLIIRQKNPSLVERTLEVTARTSQKFSATFTLEPTQDGEYASFSNSESRRIIYETGVRERKNQSFPVAMLRTSDRVFGIIADSPGLWENRCQVLLDPSQQRLAVMTGNGGDPFKMIIKPPEDARDTYQYDMDGWQSLSAGETRRFTTWVFASPARNHYDAQVAFQLAVANAKGWNASALEAILRNTSLYLLRRNLMKDENDQPRDGKYIFISGMTYGWKQWVSTGIYSALGLNDPEKMVEAYRAVFWNRMDYEDNAQYYLIWAVLTQRAGGTINAALVRRAYDFIREHEQDGFYIPPPLRGAPHPLGWKTYMDVLHYDDDDCPASNQGFHCGALMAAKELGLPVTEDEIQQAIAAYQRLFNVKLGFMPTSLKQSDTLGQDTLYGATLTYAVFGRKVLTDEQVLTHYRTSETVKSQYGLRVISTADGSLLPGHNGAYCYGGSWFFCDSGNYLLAGAQGLPADEVDARLIERIQLELIKSPAFHEDINTVTGDPHGNTPYADYSVYTWLRREFRRRLNQSEPDRVGAAVDQMLGVVRDNGTLRLAPQ